MMNSKNIRIVAGVLCALQWNGMRADWLSGLNSVVQKIQGGSNATVDFIQKVPAQVQTDEIAIKTLVTTLTTMVQQLKDSADALKGGTITGVQYGLTGIITQVAAGLNAIAHGVVVLNNSFDAVSKSAINIAGQGGIDVSNADNALTAEQNAVDTFIGKIDAIRQHAAEALTGLITTLATQIESDKQTVEKAVGAISRSGNTIKANADNLNGAPGFADGKNAIAAIVTQLSMIIEQLLRTVQALGTSLKVTADVVLMAPQKADIPVQATAAVKSVNAVTGQIQELVVQLKEIDASIGKVAGALTNMNIPAMPASGQDAGDIPQPPVDSMPE